MDILMISIMTLVYGLFLLMDFVAIYKAKSRKLIWLYLSLLIFSYSLTFLIGLGVKIPSPAPSIKKAITSLIGLPSD
jgi:hypothetical protein